ncbi:diguanylate cyclase [Actinoplanes sp. NPDC051859]|uniref:diguanylate cyclase n=1 Tax=Actinoplanes sp. NPDC051859 TaxID=3363909 RepID=UPI0037ADC1CD
MSQPRGAGWWRPWLLIGAAATVVCLLLPADIRFLGNATLGALSVAAILTAVRAYRPERATLWVVFAGAIACWTTTGVVDRIHTHVLHRPSPLWAEVLFLCGYPLLGAALALMLRSRTLRGDRTARIDAAIVAAGLFLLFWVGYLRPVALDSSISALDRFFQLAEPAGDIMLIALGALLLTTPGARSASFRLLTGALLLSTAGNIVSALPLEEAPWQQAIVDGTALSGYLVAAAAALHPSMRSLSILPSRVPTFVRPRLLLLAFVSVLGPVVGIYQGLTRDGRVDWLATSVGSMVLTLLIVLRTADLVRRVAQQAAQLEELARNDGLTGVANRRTLDTELPRILARARRSGETVTLGMIDIDHFKRYNDTYGHAGGDRLLKEATAAWQSDLRADDLLARYGGEEFTVVLSGTDHNVATALFERLRRKTPREQTFSAGLAEWDGTESPDALLARADRALYRAKEAGRNRVEVDHQARNDQDTSAPSGAGSRPAAR